MLFSSVLMPTFSQPSLMICCVFWRSVLVEVWKRTDICTPSLARYWPLFFQPASSSSAFALSGPNSAFFAVERDCGGLFGVFPVTAPPAPVERADDRVAIAG